MLIERAGSVYPIGPDGAGNKSASSLTAEEDSLVSILIERSKS